MPKLQQELKQLPKFFIYTTVLVPIDLALDAVKYTFISYCNTKIAGFIYSLGKHNEHEITFRFKSDNTISGFISEHMKELFIGAITTFYFKNTLLASTYDTVNEMSITPDPGIESGTLVSILVDFY